MKQAVDGCGRGSRGGRHWTWLYAVLFSIFALTVVEAGPQERSDGGAERPEGEAAAQDGAVPAETADGEAEEPEPVLSIRGRLDALRDDLAQMRLEKALEESARLVAEPDLTDEQRAEAWILRSQAHVMVGDLEGVEQDYREILGLRPAYEPEATLTTPEAMERFRSIRDRLVGALRFDVRPDDARILIDGEPVVVSSDGTANVLAKSVRVTIERPGFDTWEETIEVQAGRETPIDVALIPNARTVVVRTTVAGVTVAIDGRPYGETAPVDSTWAGRNEAVPAELVIDAVPLGERTFEFSKPCYRNVRKQELVRVDVMDPSPLVVGPVRLPEARATLTVDGRPEGASVWVDGRAVGELPVRLEDACPGRRIVDVRMGDALVFRETVDLVDGGSGAVAARPRPNAVLFGEDVRERLPRRWLDAINVVAERPVTPPQGLGPDDGAYWDALDLPDDVPLAIVVTDPATGELSAARAAPVAVSSRLREAAPIDGAVAGMPAPRWRENGLGFHAVDSEVGGAIRIVAVDPAGPAAAAGVRVGDAVAAVDGNDVEDMLGFRTRLALSAPGAEVGLRLEGRDGTVREIAYSGVAVPRVLPPTADPLERIVRAAWAETEAIASSAARDAALANLSLLLERAGRAEDAVASWRQVGWTRSSGVGAGTRDYVLGRLYQGSGQDARAADRLRAAARAEGATFTSSEGAAEIRPAAVDRLADLGISVEPD